MTYPWPWNEILDTPDGTSYQRFLQLTHSILITCSEELRVMPININAQKLSASRLHDKGCEKKDISQNNNKLKDVFLEDGYKALFTIVGGYNWVPSGLRARTSATSLCARERFLCIT